MKLNLHIPALGLWVLLPSSSLLEAGASFEAKLASQATDQGLVEADLNWQAAAEFSFGDFYVGGWGLQPLENEGAPDFFHERYEVYVGHGWALADTLGLDGGFTRLVNPNDDDTTEAYLGLFAELGTFSPSVYIYNDLDTDQWSAEFSTSVSLPLDLFPVDATVRLGAVDAEIDYRYFELDLIYPIELSDSVDLSVGLHYSDNDLGGGVPDSSLFGSAAFGCRF